MSQLPVQPVTGPSSAPASSGATPVEVDAVLLVSFGGPEGPDEVMPFLENVTRGRNIPRERLLEVAEHYQHFGGVSPINEQCRRLREALEAELRRRGLGLPVYWGNRNWRPMLADTMKRMKEDGVRGALAVMTSAFSSYSGCRQYREDVERAREAAGQGAPPCLKLRVFYNHPGFIEVMRERVGEALAHWPEERRHLPRILYTAHSVPSAMARLCRYESQFHEAARLVSDAFPANPWELVYQSRSGPPQMPWLEPDVGDRIRALHAAGLRDLVLVPIGFVSDHMEVMYDLDTEARELCEELGVKLARAGTVDTHPRFVAGLADLVMERLANEKAPGSSPRPALGCHGPSHDVCPPDCCLPGERRGR